MTTEYRDPTPIPDNPNYDPKDVPEVIKTNTDFVRRKMKGKDVRESLARAVDIAGIWSFKFYKEWLVSGQVAEDSIGDNKIIDVNSNKIYDTFASMQSAHSWQGDKPVVIEGRTVTFTNESGDNGIVFNVNLDKIPVTDEKVYINFNYRDPELSDSEIKSLEVLAMDLDGKPKRPELLKLNLTSKKTAGNYQMSWKLWPAWKLDKKFKLLFVLHEKGSLEITDLNVNYSNKGGSLIEQLNNIDSDQVVNLKTEKVKNTSIELSDFSVWNSSVDELLIADDELRYLKKGSGDSGVKVLLKADTTKPLYISFELQTNGVVQPYIANQFGSVVPGSIADVKGNTLKRYTYKIEPDKFALKSIENDFMFLFSAHTVGTYLKVKSVNVSNTNGLEGVSETNNNVLSNIGVRQSEVIGSDLNNSLDTVKSITKVHYVTPAESSTINDGVLKMINAKVKTAGVYNFKIGLLDQNKLIVNSTDYQFNLSAGLNHLDVESKGIVMSPGSYLFMDASSLGGVYSLEDGTFKMGSLLVQDENHQSTVPGYPGMIMYNYDGIAPFSYEVAQKSVTKQLNELKSTGKELSSNVEKLMANGGELYVTSSAGKKFRLLVDDSGTLSTVSQIPNEVAIFGNSLTKNGGEIGMAASDQYHDYYHYVVEYVKSKNTKVKVNPRTNMSVWESATNSNDRKTLFNEQIKPVLTANTDLVILQLVDNVNTPEKKATFAQDTKTLIKDIHAVSPKARIFWIAYWFGNDDLLGQIKDACNAENATLIDISSIVKMSDTKSYLGATRTGVNGETWTVTNPGEAMHPGDKGMRLIADAIIEKLGF